MMLQTQTRDHIRAWLQAFHHATDALTTDTLHKFYTQDATLQFANNVPLIGLDNIISFFETAFPQLENMKHEIVDFDVVNDKIYLTCTITYVVKGDPELEKFKVPAVGVFYLLDEKEQEKVERGDGVIKSFEVYLDAQAVWRRVEEVGAGKA